MSHAFSIISGNVILSSSDFYEHNLGLYFSFSMLETFAIFDCIPAIL